MVTLTHCNQERLEQCNTVLFQQFKCGALDEHPSSQVLRTIFYQYKCGALHEHPSSQVLRTIFYQYKCGALDEHPSSQVLRTIQTVLRGHTGAGRQTD